MAAVYEDIRSRFEARGQSQVLAHWDALDEAGRTALLAQLDAVDLDSVDATAALLKGGEEARDLSRIAPADVEPQEALSDDQLRTAGVSAIASGTVGVILVAGGQGSRLGFDGPKGAFPVGPISDATLFEIHARKILALEQAHGAEIPFYIMTSEANNAATCAFFEEHAYFGLSPERVKFFVQGMWPALTADGKIILDQPGHMFASPDGHGGILTALKRTGMLDDMAQRGLSVLFYFQVDNPLVEIADPAFIGLHILRGADMAVKVCAKRDPDEGLGVVVKDEDGRNSVVEYSELTKEQKHETLPDGTLRLRFGSVAIHTFSFDFLQKEAAASLPVHVAHKKVPYCDESGNVVTPEEANAYKFEKFIFDVLPDAERVINVAFAREEEFSPVKNAEGADSPATAQRDMMLKYARWMEACGVAVPRAEDGSLRYKIEIDPCYALGPVTLRQKLPEGFTWDGDLLLR